MLKEVADMRFTKEEMLIKERVKRQDLIKQDAFRQNLISHPKLRFLFLELTTNCNLHCRHCGSNCGNESREFIDADLVFKALREVSKDFEEELPMICLTGGEPMLHPQFERIVEKINTLGFYWGMTTNATIIDARWAKRLKELRMSTVSISIDGLRDTHNWFRRAQNDNYTHTIEAIKALQAVGFSPEVTTVVHAKNFDELDFLYEEMLALKIASWRVINIEPIGRAKEENLMLTDKQLVSLLQFIRNKRLNAGVSGMDVKYGCSHYLTTEFEREVRDWYFLCGAGIFVASILTNGDIYPCLDIERREELKSGNVRDVSILDAWTNGFKIFRQDRACSNYCSNCEDKKHCHGDSWHTWDFDNNQPRICFKKILNKQ